MCCLHVGIAYFYLLCVISLPVQQAKFFIHISVMVTDSNWAVLNLSLMHCFFAVAEFLVGHCMHS